MTAGWRRWMRIFRRDPQADVDAELRFHMDARVEDLVARGVKPEEARTQALAEFGDLSATRAVLGVIDRRMAARRRRADWWESIEHDVRYTLRGLARSPGFTVMVVATLALGIGANAAVFSVLNRLFFATPAGIEHPEHVRRIALSYAHAQQGRIPLRSVFSYPEFRGVSTMAPAGASVAGYVPGSQPYGRDPGAPRRPVEFSVGDYLRVLGLRPTLGRFFSGAELDVAGLTPVAVISHRLWLRDFHGTPDVLGQPLDLGTHRYTIIGVAPDGFAGLGLDHVDLWLPFNCLERWVDRNPHWYEQTSTLMIRPVARVESASLAQTLTAAGTRALRTNGLAWDSTASAVVAPLRGAGSPEFFQRQNAIAKRLALVAAIILLIACANVANLALSRAVARRHETAIRLALGVSRWRLMVQALSESVVVALIAGVAAAVAATWGTAILRRLVLPHISWGYTTFDPTIGWFTAAVSIVVGIVVGILPALQDSRPELMGALMRDMRAGGRGRDRGRVRSALVIVQAGLSVVLLAGAGLFVRSLQHVDAIDLGYDVSNIVYVSPRAGEDTAAARALKARMPALARRLASVPGVERTAMMYMPPMWGLSWIDTYLPDRDSLPGASEGEAPLVLLGSPGFLTTLGVRVVAGRLFSPADRAGAEPVLVVNRALARRYWPGENALGKCLILEKRTDPCRRIVGVVDNPHMSGLTEKPAPAYFVPIGQVADLRTPGTVAIRTAPGRRAAVQAVVAQVVRDALGPSAQADIQSMDDLVDPQYQQWRVGAALFSMAGLLALLVAAVGIYSSVSYGVNQRRHEIGVRMALGARGGGIARLVVGQGVRTVAVGIGLGILAALAMGRLVASLLYGVTPHDPVVLSATAAALLAVAALACLIPARRAAQVDPMETLRAE